MERDVSRLDLAARRRCAALRAAPSANVIAAGLLLTTALVLAQAASQWIDFRLFDLRIRALDSNHHASVFGAASLLAQASAAGAITLRVASPPRRPLWLILAGLIGALLIVRTFVRPQTTMLLLPLAAVFLSLCWLTLRDPVAIRSMVWGSLFLLVCSFGLHMAGPQAARAGGHLRDHTWAYQLIGMVKHGAELAGWMLLATGMAAAAWVTFATRRAHLSCGGAQT
jgi:hypothetical protein